MSMIAALLQGFDEGREAPKVRVRLPPVPITGHGKQDEDSDNKHKILNCLVLLQIPHSDASGFRKPGRAQRGVRLWSAQRIWDLCYSLCVASRGTTASLNSAGIKKIKKGLRAAYNSAECGKNAQHGGIWFTTTLPGMFTGGNRNSQTEKHKYQQTDLLPRSWMQIRTWPRFSCCCCWFLQLDDQIL